MHKASSGCGKQYSRWGGGEGVALGIVDRRQTAVDIVDRHGV